MAGSSATASELGLLRFLWPRHPRTEAGIVLGTSWLVQSMAPTLIPRDATRAILVSGLSGTAGFLVGDAAMPLRDYHGLADGSLDGGDRRRLGAYAAVIGAGLVGRGLIATGTLPDDRRAPSAAAANLATMGAAEVAAVIGTRAAEAAARRRWGRGWFVPTLAGTAAAALAGRSLARSRRADREQRDSRSPSQPSMPGVLGGALGVGGALVGLAVAHEAAVTTASRHLAPRLGVDQPQLRRALMAASAGATLWAATAAKQAYFATQERLNDGVEDGFSKPPEHPYASGGPGSSVSYATLGMQGRRFVSLRPSAATIEETIGEPAMEPIRIFVGLTSAKGLGFRVDEAIAELHRTGAFDRDVLVLASPAGTGYTNSIAVEAIELLQRGNVATVSLQYAARPSVLSLDEVPRAGDQYRYLVDRVGRELADRPGDQRPRLLVYGESLGARTSQRAFVGRGTQGIVDSGIDRVLWVGTPGGSQWAIDEFGELPTEELERDDIVRVSSGAALREVHPERLAAAHVVMLDHDNDPIPVFRPALFTTEPRWCTAPREPGSSVPPIRWLPLVTGLQVGIDTLGATNIAPGEFDGYGHDYRADLAEACLLGLSLPATSEQQLARVQDRLRASEVRAARLIEAGA